MNEDRRAELVGYRIVRIGLHVIVPHYAAPEAQTAEIDGVRIPFADLDTLIRAKQTDRFQDKADVESLEQLKRLAT